jgi:hypothetical protein
MRKPDLYNCDAPNCDKDELSEDSVTHFIVRESSPANPGTVVTEFDLCDPHANNLNKVLDDYR